MFDLHIEGARISVTANDRYATFACTKTAFILAPDSAKQRLVPIVKEMELVGRLLARLFPDRIEDGEEPAGGWCSPPPRLMREFIRLCAVLSPTLDGARERAGAKVVRLQEQALVGGQELPRVLLAPELFEDPHLADELLQQRGAMAAARWLIKEDDPREALARLRRWRGLFSPTGRSYRSLNLTLDAVDETVGLGLLCSLRWVRLRRAVTDPEQLRMMLRMVRWIKRTRHDDDAALLRVVADATRAELERAHGRIATHYGFVDMPAAHVLAGQRVINLCTTLRPTRNVRLPRMIERAIEHERLEEMRAALRELGGPKQPTAEPALPLPDHPQVRFLATVGDIMAESRLMQHCVHTLASGAVDGDLYLFHVEHDGEHATVQVDADAELSAVHGPRNTENHAVERARELFEPWCEQLREEVGGAQTRRAGERQLEIAWEVDEIRMDAAEMFEEGARSRPNRPGA